MSHSEKLCQRRSRNEHESLYGVSIFSTSLEVVHMLVYLHVFFSVGFLNDETWLNVGSTRTLMKAPLCVET